MCDIFIAMYLIGIIVSHGIWLIVKDIDDYKDLEAIERISVFFRIHMMSWIAVGMILAIICDDVDKIIKSGDV